MKTIIRRITTAVKNSLTLRNRLRWVGGLLTLALLIIASLAAHADPYRMSRRGEDSAFLQTKPWSGYWWSRQEGKLVNGWAGHPESPMQKYDRYAT